MRRFVLPTAGAMLFVIVSACTTQPPRELPNANQSLRIDAFSYHRGTGSIPSLVLSAPDLHLYNANMKQIKEIKAKPGWVAMDKAGRIYLARYAEWSSLLVYTPPYNAQPKTIPLNGYDYGLAVDWATGIFAVGEFPYTSEYASNISFFRPGSTTPCAVVQAPSGIYGDAMAFDQRGTLFFGYSRGGSGVSVASISGECSPENVTVYSPSFMGSIFAMQFDPDDNLVMDIYYYRDTIQTYAHPSGSSLGNPLASVVLQPAPNGQQAQMLTLTSDGSQLWASTFYESHFYHGEVALYNLQTGAPIKSLDIPNDWGGTVYPAP